MNTTSLSLLERLKQPVSAAAWNRFVDLYTPLLYDWSRQLGLQATDAADLVQEVFLVLLQKLPTFTYDTQGSFRGWLHTVLVNKWRQLQRRRTAAPVDPGSPILAALASPDDGDAFWQAEYQQYLVGRMLELIQAEFQPATWKAFWECVVAGRSAAEVAQELGMTVNAVYLAKSRVLRHLRRELAGLMD
jgi:RNA polymerase sigma-70 factor (ECF subfamily)